MIPLEVSSADEAWRKLHDRFRSVVVVQEGRDQPTKELLHVTTAIKDPRQRVVFARAINPALAIAEVIWILAGSDDLSFIKFWNPRWSKFSDNGVTLCGAYGYRIGSQPALTREQEKSLRHWNSEQKPLDQLKMAYEALSHYPYSRQVVLQFWDKNQDMPNPTVRSRDVPCNLVSHLLIRNQRLEWLQVMRSNDFYWGFPYNIITFTVLQEIVSGWLGIDVGEYVHISDSLHVYERHWADLKKEVTLGPDIPTNGSDLRVSSVEKWREIIRRVITYAQQLTEYTSTADLISVIRQAKDLPSAYREWIALLGAESMRRRNYYSEARRWIEKSGPYWSTSWLQWAASRQAQTTTENAILPIQT
jgi:thymidylate synthase